MISAMTGNPPLRRSTESEILLLRNLMSGKDNTAKTDDSLRPNHLVVCCDVGQLTLEARS